MRRKKQPSEKTRITLDLSKEFYDRLEKLESDTGSDSKAQVIREALRLYEYIVHRHLEGDKFIARTQNGEEETIVFLGSTAAPP